MVDSWVSWLKILDDPRASMTCETLSYHSWKFGFKPTLVGGFKATPLKNMTSSVGMMTFPRYGKIKSKCSKPPTSTCDNYEHQWNLLWNLSFLSLSHCCYHHTIRWRIDVHGPRLGSPPFQPFQAPARPPAPCQPLSKKWLQLRLRFVAISIYSCV